MVNSNSLKNLKNPATRSTAERHALASKAGKARGKQLQRQRAMREIMQDILAAPLLNKGDEKRLFKFLRSCDFADEDMTKKAGICAAIVMLALKGNIRATELTLKIVGEYPTQYTRRRVVYVHDATAAPRVKITYIDETETTTAPHRLTDGQHGEVIDVVNVAQAAALIDEASRNEARRRDG